MVQVILIALLKQMGNLYVVFKYLLLNKDDVAESFEHGV